MGVLLSRMIETSPESRLSKVEYSDANAIDSIYQSMYMVRESDISFARPEHVPHGAYIAYLN